MNSQTLKTLKKRYGKLKVFADGFAVKEALHKAGSGFVTPIIQSKPWGGEVWIVYTPQYALKNIIVERGKRFSLQKHGKKTETWYIAAGKPLVTLGKKKFTARSGYILHVKPGTGHRVEAKSDTVEIWEVSSPELWDVTRLEDDYGR